MWTIESSRRTTTVTVSPCAAWLMAFVRASEGKGSGRPRWRRTPSRSTPSTEKTSSLTSLGYRRHACGQDGGGGAAIHRPGPPQGRPEPTPASSASAPRSPSCRARARERHARLVEVASRVAADRKAQHLPRQARYEQWRQLDEQEELETAGQMIEEESTSTSGSTGRAARTAPQCPRLDDPRRATRPRVRGYGGRREHGGRTPVASGLRGRGRRGPGAGRRVTPRWGRDPARPAGPPSPGRWRAVRARRSRCRPPAGPGRVRTAAAEGRATSSGPGGSR